MLVIDFEVFAHDWLCVAYDLIKKKETVIVNDREQFVQFYERHKNDLWIGYNIRNYDIFIAKALICDFDPKEVNDFIIEKDRKGYEYSRMFNQVPLCVFDIMPNPPVGLKTLEAFGGQSICESSVPFTIERKLTDKEIEEVIEYCRHDVQQTLLVLSKRQEELTSQLELVKMFDMPRTDMGRTKAQLSATILGARKSKSRGDDLNFTIPSNLKIKKYQFVIDWFVECRERALNNIRNGVDQEVLLKEFYSQKLECDIAGVPHVFAWGGIHGARPNYNQKGYFVNVDVASYYPSMMIHYNYHSRNIVNPQKFVDIYNDRLKYKAMKDKRANPLKIVLNSTYGSMKAKSGLYDPLMANNVCVTGQLLLLDLVEHLEHRFDIVQSNTDGILVRLRATNEDEADIEFDALDDICKEWEKRSHMVLEFDEFVHVIQKDVNNYIIVDANGKYKSKGAYVKKLNSLDYDLPIVNKALINHFVKGIPVEQTVTECHDLIEFQKIVKVSSLYLYGMHNGQELNEKTFRVFASKRESDGMIYKVKTAGGKPEKFANTPEKCFIDNTQIVFDDGTKKQVPEWLDKQWYIDLAHKRINDFNEKVK